MIRYMPAILVLLATSCAIQGDESRLARAENAVADLLDSEGNSVGVATLMQTSGGVRIVAELHGLPPGDHAMHLHNVGQCHPSGDGGKPFESAGPHFNPFNRKHGLRNPEGPHAGDLPNFRVAGNGTAKVEVLAERVTLEEGKINSLFQPGGTCLVIHAQPDDHRSDPDGRAGTRIACGEIRKAGATKP